jgi:hypothetical protein
MPTTTIAANLDDSTIHALYVERLVDEVVADIEGGKLVECEADFGTIFVAPSAVRYVAAGKVRLPVSASPGAMSQSEHRAYVNPTMG